MQIVSLRHAKKHLSRLVDRVAKGEPFVIAKAGMPLVKVVPLESLSSSQVRRLGFMAGAVAVPNDFDRMGVAEKEDLFAEDQQ